MAIKSSTPGCSVLDLMFLLRSSQKLCLVLRWRSGLGRNYCNHSNHVSGEDFQHFLHFLHRMAERVCLMFSVSVAAATRKLAYKRVAEENARKPAWGWREYNTCVIIRQITNLQNLIKLHRFFAKTWTFVPSRFSNSKIICYFQA